MNRQSERLLAFFTGLGLLLVILGVVLFAPSRDAGLAYVALRAILGLAAAAFVVIVPGFLEFKWQPVVKAGGALGVFCVVFFINPPAAPAPASPPTASTFPIAIPKSHSGYLSNLYDHLQASGDDETFVLLLSSTHRRELRQFWIEPAVAAPSWSEVLRKICRKYDCLQCTPAAEAITNKVEIAWRREPILLRTSDANASPKFGCTQVALDTAGAH